MNYAEKLKDPRWQKKRLEILQRDNFTCQLCDNNKLELHVHHKEYFNGLNPWEYENDILITYCKYCHLLVESVPDTDILLKTMLFGLEGTPSFIVAYVKSQFGYVFGFYKVDVNDMSIMFSLAEKYIDEISDLRTLVGETTADV